MRIAHLSLTRTLTAAVSLALLAGACFGPDAGTPEPLPYWAQPKTLFAAEQEWWLQRTVIEAPYSATFTFVGDGDLADRVRWRIEEKYLIAERSRSLVVGATPDTDGGNDYAAPVAIYPIVRHFDVVNDQIIEAPKRPWYERQWVHVDWGQELSGSYRFILNLVEQTGPRYVVTEPDHPQHPVFEDGYFDFTTHVTVSPAAQVDPEGMIDDGYCNSWLWGAIDIFDCAAADIAFLTSFRRVPADHDYVPARYGEGAIDEGLISTMFNTGRFVVDDQYGLTDHGLDLMASRYNIWRRVRDGQGGAMPYRDREVRPIVFHLNAGFPAELVAEAQRAVDLWDAPFRTMVRELRQWECVDSGAGDLASCDRDDFEPQRVVFLCPHNPVAEGDPGACGEPGTAVRLGDMRYSMVGWIDQPRASPLVGTAWWSPDVLTGEIVSSHVQIFANDIDRAAADARDVILLATGRIAPDDLIDGSYLDGWLDQLAESANPFWSIGRYPSWSPAPPASTVADGPHHRGRPPQALTAPPSSQLSGASPSALLSRAAALAPLVGTPLEALVVDDESMLLQGIVDAGPITNPQDLDRASPLQFGYREIADKRSALANRLGAVGIDIDLPVDVNIAELVNELGSQEPDAIYLEIRRRFAFTTILHELGHALGLRHNFLGSYDSLNYHPRYWQLRNDGLVGPRYRDPLTAAETEGRIWEYMYASVMDYHPSVNAYQHGLGSYDVAVLKAVYAGLVEVFEVGAGGVTVSGNEARLQALYRYSPLAMVPLINVPDPSSPIGLRHEGFHPSSLGTLLGDISQRRFVPASHLQDTYGWGMSVADADGRLKVPYMACNDERVQAFPTCSRYDQGADPFEIMSYYINYFEASYPIHSFRRARRSFGPDSYIPAMWSRVFYPTKMMQNFQSHFHWEWDAIEPDVFTRDELYRPLEEAVALSFNFLGRLLTTPEAGSHVLTSFPTGATMLTPHFQPVAHADPPVLDADLEIPLGPGRIYRSLSQESPRGLQIANIGSAVDKELALETLLDPSFFYFPGRETWQDPVLWMTNYYRTYPKQLIDLVGGLVAGSWQEVGPGADAGGALSYRDLLDLTSTAGGTPVAPAIGFNLRIRILVYVLGLMFASYSDRTMLEYARVVALGSGEEFSSTLPSVDFTDPWTGKTYRAYSYLEDARELGIGARLLQHASALAAAQAAATTPEQRLAIDKLLRTQIDVIEIARQVVRRYDETLFSGVANAPAD